MYSWIVLKVSAIRLRRRRIPLLVLGTAAVMVVRYYLYWKLRDGMLGLYLSTIIYDVVMVPSTVTVMLRYYCLTMQALGGTHIRGFSGSARDLHTHLIIHLSAFPKHIQ